MKKTVEGGRLTIYLSGHIDSSNAVKIEKEVTDILSSTDHTSVVIDLKDLEYISSAGLRIMLKVRKMESDLCAVNASSSVYEIFDMTGFTELIDISKAMREISIKGCEVIGEGANGKVYRIDRDTIVKVYKDHVSLDDIQHERELARTAFLLGIPTAISFDVVKVGEGYGAVFEMLNARSFCSLMLESVDNLETVAAKSIEIAKIIHSTLAPLILPDEFEIVKGWHDEVREYFTDDENAKMDAMLDSLPDNGTMIHGDYHIKNIMQQDSETLLIDMDTLSKGHPIFELGFMYNAYKGFGLVDPGVVERFMGFSIDIAYRLWRRMLALYIGTDDENSLDSTEDKAALIGMLRLMRRRGLKDTEEGRALISAAQSEIKAILKRIDTLDFDIYED